MRFIELLDNVNEGWSIKEKSKYIYNSICKKISYDKRFMYSKNKELLQSIYYRQVDVEKDEDLRFVCRTANLIYLQLLEKLGIKAKLILKKSSIQRPIDIDDVALVFWDENGNKYYTNIVGDIENCKFDLKTDFFGIVKNQYEEAQDVKEIPADELEQIDLKTGIINQYGYSNILFKLIVDEVKNTNNFKNFLQSQGIDTSNFTREDILRNKIMYLTRFFKFIDKTADACERKKFYKILFCGSSLDKFESKKFHAFEFVKEEENELENLSVIQIDFSDSPIYYIYSLEEETYVKVSPDDLLKMIENFNEIKDRKLAIQQDNLERAGEDCEFCI